MKFLKSISFQVLILLIAFLSISFSGTSQSKKPKKKKKEKTAITKDKSNKAAKRAAYNKGVDGHNTIQDKKTRKRMKKTRKRSMIHAGKKKVPFYKRWFRR